jgi:hypothetical protein
VIGNAPCTYCESRATKKATCRRSSHRRCRTGQEVIEERRAELAAITLSWMFTLSNRRMRDQATKVLATLLSVRLPLAVRIVRTFGSCKRLCGGTCCRLWCGALMKVFPSWPRRCMKRYSPSRHLAFSSRLPRARLDRRLIFSERPAADALDVDVDALCVRFW